MENRDNTVDLSSVNKTKNRLKLPIISNPFRKKSTSPNRDQEGKFTSGSGGLFSNKKFDIKRALPVVVVVALVGGFLVYRSFAAVTFPSEYQYSVVDCKVGSSAQIAACKNKSAEALVYRMQWAALGRQTDYGYKTWTQKLAGDRIASQRVAEEMEGTADARYGNITNQQFVDKIATFSTPAQRAAWTRELDQKKLTRTQLATNLGNLFKMSANKVLMPAYKHNNQQFVGAIYKNLLKRPLAQTATAPAQAPANDYWVGQLNTEKMSRAQVIVAIAKSSEAKDKSRSDMLAYVGAKPKVAITQTAKNKQAARNRQLAALVSSSKTHYTKGADYHRGKVAKLANDAAIHARPSVPSLSGVNAIAGIKNQAEQHKRNAQASATNAQNDLKKAEAIFKEAKAVNAFSPDISSETAESSRNQVAIYAAQSKNKVDDISRYISQISSSYTSAKNRYDAEQRRLAEEAARRERERREQEQRDSGSPVSTGEDVVPISGQNNAEKKRQCNALQTTTERTSISNGVRVRVNDPVWVDSNNTCVTRFTITINCNSGYQPSGYSCVSAGGIPTNMTRQWKSVPSSIRCQRNYNPTSASVSIPNSGYSVTARSCIYGPFSRGQSHSNPADNFKMPGVSCGGGYTLKQIPYTRSEYYACKRI